MQLAREGSPPPGSRLPQAKLLRNSSQLTRGRIRRFESDMPSQPVRSLNGNPQAGPKTPAVPTITAGVPFACTLPLTATAIRFQPFHTGKGRRLYQQHRYAEVDALRGIAALIVLL
jgi:hypothetical protein